MVIRPPLFARVWFVVFPLIFAVVLVTTALRPGGGLSAVSVVPALMLVVVVLFAYRMSTMRIALTEDELIVRNRFSTARYPRSELTGFRRGTAENLPSHFVPQAILRDGTAVRLELAGSLLFTNRARQAYDDKIAQMESWARTSGGSPQPSARQP